MAALVAFAAVAVQGEFHFPRAPAGWGGLLALTFLYGTAFTIMFTVLPKLGVVGNSAIMNVEPIFALVLAWAILGQRSRRRRSAAACSSWPPSSGWASAAAGEGRAGRAAPRGAPD